MKKRYSLLSITLMITILVTSCSQKRSFNNTDMLIDESMMPENWTLLNTTEFNRENGDNEEGEQSGAEIIFYKSDTSNLVRGGQTVFRYKSVLGASWHYQRLEKYYFTSNARETQPSIPDGFMFSSSIANRWHFGCSNATFSPTPEFGNVSTICQYLAQYEEFLVYAPITIQIDDQIMISMGDVNYFVSSIDKTMSHYLKIEK